VTLRAERQSARMSKITNDGLIRSDTGSFIAVPYGNSGRQRVKFSLHVPQLSATGVSMRTEVCLMQSHSIANEYRNVLLTVSDGL